MNELLLRDTYMEREEQGKLHLETVMTPQMQADRATGLPRGLFFLSSFFFFSFLHKRRAFSRSGILIFFFLLAIQLLLHLSHLRASHLSPKKMISVHVA